MYTIATAGHIDHGKSALVKALTGKDPDRLPEEKRREMTIELGFASFKLDTGEEVGIVDVPGHERFIKTMIAGVGTLDMVMFIVAADDGWMPQSAEHLAILSYLEQRHGLIVLTKVDLADRDWIELVKADIKTKVAGTFLADAEIIEFSAADNRNLDKIKEAVGAILKNTKRPELLDSGRLFVDRSFTIAGTGTVVTGTLREGMMKVGQELIHHPSGETVKVKSLESFYSHLDQAPPGIRLAVGLQSVSRENIKRGDLLYFPANLNSSTTIAVKIFPEDRQAHFLKHGREIALLHGTSEIDGRLLLPATEVRSADGAMIAVLELEEPAVAKSGDHFVLRLPTPSVLVGGGMVIDPLLPPFRRKDTGRWRLLQAAAMIGADDLLRYKLRMHMIAEADTLLVQTLFSQQVVQSAVGKLVEGKETLQRGKYLILKSVWDEQSKLVVDAIEKFHKLNQHLEAMPLAELESQSECPQALFQLLTESLISQGKLARFGAGIKLAQYSADLSPELRKLKDELVASLSDPQNPAIARKELLSKHKKASEVYAFLKQKNDIVETGGLVFLREIFERLTGQIIELIRKNGQITVADARDVTGTSRKVAVPLLEEMDRRRITIREGDYRKLAQ